MRRRAPSAAAAREIRRDTALRRARTCYDHLAGVAGVALFAGLRRRGWLARRAGGYRLTSAGAQALAARGVAVGAAQAARRPFARPCLDWTERRPHLAGALGAAILGALAARGVIRRAPRARVVTIQRPLAGWLG